MSKSIIIEGDVFADIDGFYDLVQSILTDGSVRTGHNLDAFCDLLRGGFGFHEYGEPLDIVWRDFDVTRSVLGDTTALNLVEIILDPHAGHNCTLHIVN